MDSAIVSLIPPSLEHDQNTTAAMRVGTKEAGWEHVEVGGSIPPKSVAPLHAPNWTPILEKPVYTPRKLRMVCIGAGYSGLMLAYHLRDMGMEDYIDLKIYEKNHDVGGTWLENRYPGVAWYVPFSVAKENDVTSGCANTCVSDVPAR
jgi:hypothetical protein